MELGWSFVWKCVIIVLTGIALVRLAGRKSISQMTVATTVVMISIGELLAQGIVEKSVLRAVAAVALFLTTLVALEWSVVKSARIQRWISGRTIPIIRDGKVDIRQLQKLRMTQDQLEMRLRQKGIVRVSDVQNATIEINGELGYELKREARPLTVGEFEKLLVHWKLLPDTHAAPSSPNLFPDADDRSSGSYEPPSALQ